MTEKNDKKKQRTDAELLEALERMEALEETLAMSDEQIDAEMRAEGRDPDEVGKRYVEHVKKLVGETGPQRLAAGVSREHLEERVAERAKDEPRVAQALAGRKPEDLTLEELISLLKM